MVLKKEIIHLIREGIDKFIDLVEDVPFIVLTEADFRSLLYMTLYNYRKIFRKPIRCEHTESKTNILHTELYYKQGGYYDIAILDPYKYKSGSHLKNKPILAGVELKLMENRAPRSVLKRMERDSYAFDNRKNYKSAEYGFVIFVNQDRESTKEQLNRIKKDLKSLKKKRGLKKVYFNYIEIPEGRSKDIQIIEV
ncbi:MAG: hypothetical protein KKH52_03835 [Nanoarchaeota archaeon]|nr:hypothetical protein [Nanoarchaeota archaeon]MBU1622557.1 hypothetical protein [Nanoarchaeota archaeon]MBU1974499.1 hypothetical protein [Nanoarchaeota archaeon]